MLQQTPLLKGSALCDSHLPISFSYQVESYTEAPNHKTPHENKYTQLKQ